MSSMENILESLNKVPSNASKFGYRGVLFDGDIVKSVFDIDGSKYFVIYSTVDDLYWVKDAQGKHIKGTSSNGNKIRFKDFKKSYKEAEDFIKNFVHNGGTLRIEENVHLNKALDSMRDILGNNIGKPAGNNFVKGLDFDVTNYYVRFDDTEQKFYASGKDGGYLMGTLDGVRYASKVFSATTEPKLHSFIQGFVNAGGIITYADEV